ncbi:hypothetical protein HT031_005182 [Scenedesmus sp. PABB004]|nr:hypothetical protein HT031_005182 [Scenedesmus sp. PABB004]
MLLAACGQHARAAAAGTGPSLAPRSGRASRAFCAGAAPPACRRGGGGSGSSGRAARAARRELLSAALLPRLAAGRGSGVVAMAAADGGERDLLIVGPGVLGSYLGVLWREAFPGAAVTAQTNSDANHERLRKMGLSPVTRDGVPPGKTFPYVLFSAPPSGSEDYPAAVAAAAAQWDGRGSFVFTSSMSVCATNDGGAVGEDCPLVPAGAAPSTDRLLGAEAAALSAGGNVLRLVGLYHAGRGPHTFFMRQGEVARYGGYVVNMIHYEDAARLALAILRGDGEAGGSGAGYRGQVFVGTDGHPLTFEDMVAACAQSGLFPGAAPVTFTGGPEGGVGKRVSNDATRARLGGWAPRHASFRDFFIAGRGADYYAQSGLLAAAPRALLRRQPSRRGGGAMHAFGAHHRKMDDAPLEPVAGSFMGSLGAEGCGMSLVTSAMPSARQLARMRQKLSPEELQAAFARREAALAVVKKAASRDWTPEYLPPSIVPQRFGKGSLLKKAARVSSEMILKDVGMARKTKIVCTLGPACWSEEGLAALLDAGMNVARFNFSHGDHDSHGQVLDRLRTIAEARGSVIAYALDTKGPEIRTAMLRGGKDIHLAKGQEVEVVAVGPEAYTSWEGYVDEASGRAVIGLSYDKLCQFLRPGNTILLSDGTITIEVKEILDDRRLLGVCQNAHKLGQRKNCNLPGVTVDLPVLGPKDVADVTGFAAARGLDYIFASFVQSAADVRFIREVLEGAGAPHIKIIAKIESQAGLLALDEVVMEADGVMVARGDLAMEIPPEKVALAQKLMINKCQAYGKLVICATQMMESMIDSPAPSRAEMTDVANAVFDGTGAVMLSGETANGRYPALVVSTMAAIVANAELAVDYGEQFHAIRANNAGLEPVSPAESLLEGVCTQALGFCADADGDGVIELGEGCLIVVLTRSGLAAQLVSKYRPPCPVVAVGDDPAALRGLAGYYAVYCCQVASLSADPDAAVRAGMRMALAQGLLTDGMKVLQVTGTDGCADAAPVVTTENLGLRANSFIQKRDAPHYTSAYAGGTTHWRSTVRIGRDVVAAPPARYRSLKIVATLGPATWTPEGMARIMTAQVDVVRFNVKHQSPEQNQALLDLWRAAADARRAEERAALGLTDLVEPKLSHVGIMVSIRGHEVRSARLDGGAAVAVGEGETLEFVGVGEEYYSWVGGRAAPGLVRVGLSLRNVGVAAHPGDVIQLDDGELKVRVTEVLSPTSVRGVALNAHKLRELALVHVHGARHVEAPALSARCIADLAFAAANQATYVSVPFVRSAADVLEVRRLLDEAGGPGVKVVAQIDTGSAVRAYDEILAVADAIMVSRTNLAMLVRPEKVALAQKWLIQKARLAGRPVMVAGQLMETMAAAPRPSRPEITDVVNAVYDGADAVVLMQETSCGLFAHECVSTTAAIIADAEGSLDHSSNYSFIRNFTPKPLATIEAAASSAAEAVLDAQAGLLVVLADSSAPLRWAAKYRPGVPLLALTRVHAVAASAGLAVEISRKFSSAGGTPQFQAGDGHSDVLVALSGPDADPFLDVHNFNTAQVAALVFGDESTSLTEPVGYRGAQTLSMRSTKVGLDLIIDPVHSARKTKIVCTLGPACWSEEGLAALLDAGMNVARFNFSHGDHDSHGQVLDRLRTVAAAKGAHHVATLLDTKGPEIRTAMLRGGKDIQLAKGQEVEVVAVGPEAYTSWEGYVDEASGRAVIGLSYDKLCRDVKPGGRILLADGAITIQVKEILDASRLLGVCLNAKSLGQRKNCNLPGVLVDLPVLGPKDVADVTGFAAARGMDFVAASFVQSGDDVRFIRRVLDGAGGGGVRIISKIESWHGVINYDDILAASDGIMVARGDLAMEVPSEKVALAQKMMTTKANIAGKFVVIATQMLESMTANPLPTRAEMTDVANAVFDGADAVMLSGETANGAWPALAVSTMASIVTNAEVGVNSYQAFQFIRAFTDRPMSSRQALLANVAKNVIDTDAGLVLVHAGGRTGTACDTQDALDYVRYVVKYRPAVPVLLLTEDAALVRATAPLYGVHARLFASTPRAAQSLEHELFLEDAVLSAVRDGLCPPGSQVVCALQTHQPALEVAGAGAGGGEGAEVPMLSFKVAPGRAEDARPRSRPGTAGGAKAGEGALSRAFRGLAAGAAGSGGDGAPAGSSPRARAAGAAGGAAHNGNGSGGGRRDSEAYWAKTLSLRNTSIALEDILQPHDGAARKTKIVCTLGPACWSEEGLAALLDAGMNVARFNFSHGDHDSHLQVLQRLRKVAAAKGSPVSFLLDTKGPEIRTAMLRGGSLELAHGQEVVLVAVGEEYKTWEGGLNPDTGVAEIGVSYDKLASSVAPGWLVKLADGGLSIRVAEVLDAKRVKGVCLNAKALGQNKNVNLPGVQVDLPVLTSKDINDLVCFAVRHKFDFVAASFVQSGDDVRFIREVLDRSGGASIKVMSKIENEAGLEHYDDILAVTDGVMVARGDLAMEVPSEKVALAQKMMTTKANIAGKFVVIATQMLESMTANPLPTRAEMTDVANAVFDGADAVMLSGETANGAWPALAVSTMAAIVANAEVANSYYSSATFMLDHTSKPYSRLEALAGAVCCAVTDANAQLVVVCSATGEAARLVSKYRPYVPQVVVTDSDVVLREAGVHFGQHGFAVPVLDDAPSLALQAMDWAHEQGLWGGVGAVLLVAGHYEANADMMPNLRVLQARRGRSAGAQAQAPVTDAARAGTAAAAEAPAAAASPVAAPAAAAEPGAPAPAPVAAAAAELEVDGLDEVEVSPELLRTLSRRMSLRRSSMPTPGGPGPLRRQFSKASGASPATRSRPDPAPATPRARRRAARTPAAAPTPVAAARLPAAMRAAAALWILVALLVALGAAAQSSPAPAAARAAGAAAPAAARAARAAAPAAAGAPAPAAAGSAAPAAPPAASSASSKPAPSAKRSFALPLRTAGRWIVDAKGERVRLKCSSWSGAQVGWDGRALAAAGCARGGSLRPATRRRRRMAPPPPVQERWYVPSGLWAVQRDVVPALLRSAGFNCVRLVWSLEMALGRANGSAAVVPPAAVAANPDLVGKPPLAVLDAVIAAIARAGLLVVLDNHSSDAMWCCGLTDGNGLWYTDAWSEARWLEGWGLMARRYARVQAVIGVGLRNEPRPTFRRGALVMPTWGGADPATDYALAFEKAAAAVLAVRPGTLVFAQGMLGGRDLRGARRRPLVLRAGWPDGPVVTNATVYEVHEYPFLWGSFDFTDYASYARRLDEAWGYLLSSGAAPVWLGEFGTEHTAAGLAKPWWRALTRYIKERSLDWAYWPLDGQQGPSRAWRAEETYGLLNTTWNGWASAALLAELQALM